jgi:hypothetical protein
MYRSEVGMASHTIIDFLVTGLITYTFVIEFSKTYDLPYLGSITNNFQGGYLRTSSLMHNQCLLPNK